MLVWWGVGVVGRSRLVFPVYSGSRRADPQKALRMGLTLIVVRTVSPVLRPGASLPFKATRRTWAIVVSGELCDDTAASVYLGRGDLREGSVTHEGSGMAPSMRTLVPRSSLQAIDQIHTTVRQIRYVCEAKLAPAQIRRTPRGPTRGGHVRVQLFNTVWPWLGSVVTHVHMSEMFVDVHFVEGGGYWCSLSFPHRGWGYVPY